MATLIAAPAAEDTRPPAFQNVIYDKEDANRLCDDQSSAECSTRSTRPPWPNCAPLSKMRATTTPSAASFSPVRATRRSLPVPISASSKRLRAVEAERSSRCAQEAFDLIENLGKPVIAAVNGFALGGGCEAAMACTIRIAVPNARFGQPEVKLGVLPGGGGTQRLPRLVGKGRALQLILTGGMIDAEEAYRIGLVNEIVPAGTLIPRAEAILQEIAANAPIGVRLALQAANIESQAEGLALEASYFGLCAGTEDKAEGTLAFLEKRAPHFRGR